MKKYNVAILGASGAVGQQMLQVLEEYNIPVDTLLPLASARSAGEKIKFQGREVEIQEAREDSFQGMDFVLGAVKNAMSKKFAPAIVKSGAVYIDNSSAFRLDPEVPLIVPEINGADALNNRGIIANPNCSTIITLSHKVHDSLHLSGCVRGRSGRLCRTGGPDGCRRKRRGDAVQGLSHSDSPERHPPHRRRAG